MFSNPYIGALVLGAVAAAAAFGIGVFIKKKEPGAETKPWQLSLLCGLTAMAVAYTAIRTAEDGAVLVPFTQWARVNEIGYKAIWAEFARNVLPFALVGFFVPPLFKKTNTLGKAALWALGVAAAMGVVSLIGAGFNTDSVIGAFLGVLVGFGLFAFLKLFFTKASFFREPVMKKKTHLGSLAVVFAVYFACVALILVDNGGEFVKLSIFTPDTKLPADITCEVELSSSADSMLTYSTVMSHPKNDAKKIAESFGMDTSAVEADAENKRAMVTDGTRSISTNLTGEWKYIDDGFAGDPAAETADESLYIQNAQQLIDMIALPFDEYSVTEVAFAKKKDAAGQLVPAVQVHLSAAPQGNMVQGSCEVVVTYWYDGTLYTVDKYSSDFKENRTVTMISQQEAWSMVEAGGAAHTLWSEAESARVVSVEKAYWLEEIKGDLQPIWLFRGIAAKVDGSEVDFNIFVPAMDY